MPGPVLIAETPLLQLSDYLLADQIMGRLAGTRIWPRRDADTEPETDQTPFVWIRELPDVPTGPHALNEVSFVIETHDQPRSGRGVIYQMIQRCEWILDGVYWGETTGSIRHPMRSWWRGSVLALDEGWGTQKYMGTVVLVAA